METPTHAYTYIPIYLYYTAAVHVDLSYLDEIIFYVAVHRSPTADLIYWIVVYNMYWDVLCHIEIAKKRARGVLYRNIERKIILYGIRKRAVEDAVIVHTVPAVRSILFTYT